MMLHRGKNLVGLFVAGLAVLLAGCDTADRPAAPARPTETPLSLVTVVPNYYVNLDAPSVVIDHGNTNISGTVRRKPGVRWLLVGRVDIEFVAPNGEVLDELPALITPKTISMDPNAPSVYSTSYGYVAPAGSTVRVHFVDSDTQAREDLEGFDFNSGSASNVGGGITGGNGGGHIPPASHAGVGRGHGGGVGTHW